MTIKQVNFLKLVRQAFNETMTTEYKRNKIWWSEKDITGAFYHLLRPVIDLTPNYGLFWEWREDFEEGDYCIIDLVIAEIDPNEEAEIQIAMEFKWGFSKKQKKEAIEQDAEKLTRLMKEGTTNHAFLFIFDLSEKKEKVDEAIKRYKELNKQFPKVEILWGFPAKKNG